MYARIAIYAGIILGAVAIAAGLISYGYYRKGLEVDAAVMTQSIKSTETVVKQEQNTAKEVVKYIQVKGKTEVITNIVEKEVVKYVYRHDPTCQLSADLVESFDRISRMYEPTADGVPSPGDASGDLDGRALTDVTCAEVLQAYAHAAKGWRELWDKYHPLTDWTSSNHVIARAGSGHALLFEGVLENGR